MSTPGEIALDPQMRLDSEDASEIMRVWIHDAGPSTVLIMPCLEPRVFGILLADCARHAALAYASSGDDEAEALAAIIDGFGEESASHYHDVAPYDPAEKLN